MLQMWFYVKMQWSGMILLANSQWIWEIGLHKNGVIEKNLKLLLWKIPDEL